MQLRPAKGYFEFVWKRLKSILPTFLICFVFSAIYFFLNPSFMILDVFGYLWYVPLMFLGFAVIYIFKRLSKTQKQFNILCLVTVIISYALLFSVLKGFGLLRAVGGISLGVLVSQIPKIRVNNNKFNINILF